VNKIALRFLSTILALALAGVVDSGPASAGSLQPARLPLELYEQIPVPGHQGRIDHFTGNGHLVLFSVVGSNGVGIENWFDGRAAGFIPGVPEPQGVLYVPGFDKIVVASSQGKVYIFNGKSHRLEKTIDLGTDADNVRWDPVHKRVLVGFGEDEGGIASIDPATDARVGPVLKTGGHPEGFQIELHGPMVYLNCPDAGQVVEAVNRDTGQVTKWPLRGVSGNFAMALDEADHRVFTATRKIPMLLAFNTETGEQVAAVPGIVGESDDVYFDSVRKRIYIIGGQGYVSVVQQITPDRYGLIANVPTKVGARTGYWNEEHDRLYVGVQAEGNAPAQILGFEAEDY
jgi:hypothetical protein